jgi:hypothetical protein
MSNYIFFIAGETLENIHVVNMNLRVSLLLENV